MNPISFDTYIRRDAYRNGWDNYEPDADGTGRWLSSTAHEGLLHVFPEGGFVRDNVVLAAQRGEKYGTYRPTTSTTKASVNADATRSNKG